jgi:uncharacterized protein YciW
MVWERAFLRFASELKTSDLSPATRDSDTFSDQLESEHGKLGNVKTQLAKLKAAMKKLPDVVAALEAAAELESERKSIETRIERLKGQVADSQSQPLHETQELIDLLNAAEGDERDELRRRLRQKIRHVVNVIWILVEQFPNKAKRLIAQCHFTAGNYGQLVVLVRDGHATVSYEIGRRKRIPDVLDVRNWRVAGAMSIEEKHKRLRQFPIDELEPETGSWTEKARSK